jgi:hypothetical protein
VFRVAADAGEAFADDPRNEKSTIQAMAKASMTGYRHRRHYQHTADRHQFHAAMAGLATCGPTAWHAAYNAMREAAQAANVADPDSCDPAELQHQADLLRCLFGTHPFQRKLIDSTWLDWDVGTVVQIARAVHEQDAFDRMPILGDALEEAGCTDLDILGHCRGVGPHIRGCWVVNLILGQS